MDLKSEVERAVEAGIEPISMDSYQIYSARSLRPLAYRTELRINSTLTGVLTHAEYDVAAEKSERGILLAERALKYTVRAIERYAERGKHVEFISTRCPVSILTNTDFVEALKKAVDGDNRKAAKLCIEFPSNLMYSNPSQVRPVLEGMRQLGVKSMISDFGGEFCPLMRLGEFPVDFVSLTPQSVNALKDEKTSKSLETMISFVRDLRINVIANVLHTDEEIEFFTHADCYGYRREEEPEPLLSRE